MTIMLLPDPGQLQAFFAKAEARDKTSRAFQYAARALMGLCVYLQQHNFSSAYWTEERISSIQQKSRNVLQMLSDARRTHRWFKELQVTNKLSGIAQKALGRYYYYLFVRSWWGWGAEMEEFAPPTAGVDFLELINLVSKTILAKFFIRDHLAWLAKVKLIDAEPRNIIRANLRWYAVSHSLQCFYQLVGAMWAFFELVVRSREEDEEGAEEDVGDHALSQAGASAPGAQTEKLSEVSDPGVQQPTAVEGAATSVEGGAISTMSLPDGGGPSRRTTPRGTPRAGSKRSSLRGSPEVAATPPREAARPAAAGGGPPPPPDRINSTPVPTVRTLSDLVEQDRHAVHSTGGGVLEDGAAGAPPRPLGPRRGSASGLSVLCCNKVRNVAPHANAP